MGDGCTVNAHDDGIVLVASLAVSMALAETATIVGAAPISLVRPDNRRLSRERRYWDACLEHVPRRRVKNKWWLYPLFDLAQICPRRTTPHETVSEARRSRRLSIPAIRLIQR
jgi:hypothetical protein